MKTDDFSTQDFEVWLKSDKNRKSLQRIANAIYIRMEQRKLDLPGVALHLIGPDDIFQELMIFLLNDEGTRIGLLTGSPGIMKNLQRFLWHRMVDLSRSRESNQDIYKNTWRLFYRHITEVMGQSDLFTKEKLSSGYIVFGLTHESCRTIVMMEDIIDIAYPEDLPAVFKTLNTKKNILHLAEHFWTQAALKTNEPNIRLSIRDFISWIENYVDLKARISSYSETYEDNDDERNPPTKASQAPHNMVKIQKLAAWAQNFYHTLKGLEKKIFYYYECQGLTHQQISGLMDKKGNLSYQRDKIRENLKAFLRPLDWISPDYGKNQNDPDDFIFFRDQLCKLLSIAIEGQRAI